MVGVLVALAGAELALASAVDVPGEAGARFERAGGDGALVLEHTAVRATVDGGLATVEVEQRFHNPFEEPVDATYLFPLPPAAAVRGMSMQCGTRLVVAEIALREDARKAYEEAAAQGRKAALLEEERTNLFRQSVASLCPGEDVVVTLTYLDPLVHEDGHVELSFPTTVGPRYRPEGVSEPPFTTVSSRDVEIVVTIAEGLPVEALWSDTHEIEVRSENDEATVVGNARTDAMPNKDFHLAWSLAGAETRVSALALPPSGSEAGYVAVTLQPEVLEDLEEVRPRELLFVLDESCSMSGEPFAAEVATVREAMSRMRPEDRFDLVGFSDAARALFPAPVAATPENVARAEEWLQAFDGLGTEMTAGIVRSLDLPRDPERLRLVLLLTDGFIGNESEVLRTVSDHLGDARLFSLGVGSSVNHALLDALAEVGRGDATYQLPDTPPGEVVEAFYDRIDHPALTDLELDWGGLDVFDVFPQRLPDLFAGQEVRVVARYRGPPTGTTLTLTGSGARESFEIRRPLDLVEAEAHPGLPALWARRAIADLERDEVIEQADVSGAITTLALRHHLVSSTTSLVAIEKTPSSCGASPSEVAVPSMVPEGVDLAPTGLLGGLSGSGFGLGGGGTAIGMGGLGTRGLGSGSSGYGTGGGTFSPAAGGIAQAGEPLILGSLDRSVIEAGIRRYASQVRYCYLRELSKTPELAGRLVVKFTIGEDGTVPSAVISSSTLGNAAIEACVLGRFRHMTFPAPAGGGSVVVSYPFVFTP